MPEHLRLLIIWTSQQDYRWTFIVFIWQMGKLRLMLCTRRGQHHRTVETVLGRRSDQSDTLVFIQWVVQKLQYAWNPSAVHKVHISDVHPQRFWSDDYGVGQRKTHLSTFSRWLSHRWTWDDFLCFLTSPAFSGGRRGLQCYLKVLASALLPGTCLPSPGFLLL